MTDYYSRHFVTTEWDQRLPLHLDSIGYDEHQSAIFRDQGFYCYHWLHTVEGSGEFEVGGRTFRLSPHQGILLKPNVPHSYRPLTAKWSTWYMTFDGALANPIAAAMDLPMMTPFGWEADSPLGRLHAEYGEKCRYSFDFAGMSGSLEVYAFLTKVKQHIQVSGRPSLSKGHERLTPLYLLIEEQYGDPGLGLPQMAETLGISSQHLSTLFRKSWGMSPYQYLLQFRIQKSKEFLLKFPGRPVKEIAGQVGFQDYSHFVSTFRKLAGMTPATFRQHFSV
ncbi:helix-turn-helix transcriptional regulator [Cohnella sp. REN36]|uniref:AraC family transcriptional regulator n=1 Tax=Cohnella sp. REN36 TaxID=2887347 RepID=UPI001D13A591|nr:helix-turn-helix transcriptional regulator [Cohnella sp. REN36]MCC3375468.1 AraC family transcriptional regulator [Cohnella sp. REN36]